MARTRRIETYSIVIVTEDGSVEIKNSVSPEECKAVVASYVNDASTRLFVFSGAQLSWSSEIVLHPADAPIQKPVTKRGRKPKPVEVPPVDKKAANGERKETQP